MPALATLLGQVDNGTLLLPEFQRGYVWNRDQVRGLMRSLYKGHPVGGLLLWETGSDAVSVRGRPSGDGTRLLLLDGQQRITTLYGIIRGRPPAFFEGDVAAFTGLHFNLAEERFEFYAPSKMAEDPRWIDVTRLFIDGIESELGPFEGSPELLTYVTRLSRLHDVLNRDFQQETIAGEDKDVDDVVEIFNRVNSGGTKLTKGDLALAKVCAQWPRAREVMREKLARWRNAGFDFTLDWLLRNVTAVATGRAVYTALDRVSTAEFQDAVERASAHIGTLLDAMSGRLGLDHDRVLLARYGFPVVARLLELNGGRFDDAAHRDKVLYWCVHAALWGRFAGRTESNMQQDYDTVERSGVEGLIAALERSRGGNLDVSAHDLEGSTRGSRFYPLLYMLTRISGARDLGSGLALRAEMLGRLSSLQVHHIFPKDLLYKAGYERKQVNAVANFCFLTQDTNLAIGKRPPEEYFAEAERKHPGVLASQWIPADPDLWRVDRYPEFLAARRELLADAARSFLDELRTGSTASADLGPLVIAEDGDDDRARLSELVAELRALGCAEPAIDAEIADPVDGTPLAVAEALWPEGLQPGQGNPVLVELDAEPRTLARLAELGYEVFTSTEALRGAVHRRHRDDAAEPAA